MSLEKNRKEGYKDADAVLPFEVFEAMDEKQISDEINGVFIKTLVYQFEDSNGRTVTGLSVRGVEEAARFMVKHGYEIFADKASITEETDKEFRSSCKVTYVATNGKKMETYGYSRTLKRFMNGKTNEFAYVQALSKAQRNALRTSIPEKMMSTLIEKFLSEGKGEKVKGLTVLKDEPPPQISIQEPAPISEEPKIPSIETGKPTKNYRVLKPYQTRFLDPDTGESHVVDLKPEDVTNIFAEKTAQGLIEQGILQDITDSKKKEERSTHLSHVIRTDVSDNMGSIVQMAGGVKIVFVPQLPKIVTNDLVEIFLVKKIIKTMQEAGKAQSYTLNSTPTNYIDIFINCTINDETWKSLCGAVNWLVEKVWQKATEK